MRRSRTGLAGLVVGGALAAAFAALTLLGSGRPAEAAGSCNINWVGPATGGLWDAANTGNWDLGRLPQAGDVVCIGSYVTGTVTYDSGTGVALGGLEAPNATIDVTNGELGINGDSVTTNTVGGLSISNSGTFGDLNYPEASLTDTGTFSWTAGSFEAEPTEATIPTLTVTSTATAATIDNTDLLDHWDLSFSGDLTVTTGFAMTNGGAVSVAGQALLEDGTTVSDSGGSAGAFSVTGVNSSLTKPDTGGTVSLDVPVDASGALSVPDGGFNLGTSAGTGYIDSFTDPAGSSLTLDDESIDGGTNSGGGTLYLEDTVTDTVPLDIGTVEEVSGVTTAQSALSVGSLTVSGGELSLAGAGNQVGGFSMTGGSVGDTTNPQGSLTDTGTFSWTGGSFEAPVSQSSLPVLSVTSTTDSASVNNPSQVDHWALDFSGPLSVSGSVAFSAGGGITDAGTTTFADGATITNGGSPGAFSATAAGAAVTKESSAGTVTLNVPVDMTGALSVPGGQLGLDGGGTVDGFTVSGGATLTLEGTVIAGGTNSGSGTLDLGGTVTDDAPLDVSTVAVLSGVTTVESALDVASLTVSGGELNLAVSGGRVGAFAMTSGLVGDTTDNQGSLTDTGAFSWTGGSFEAPAAQATLPVLSVTSTTATATVNNNSQIDHWNVDFAGPVVVSDQVTFATGGGITISGSASLANGTPVAGGASPGALNVTSTGTLTKQSTSGAATVGVAVVNDGMVQVGGGTLSVASLTNNGTVDLAQGIMSVGSAYTAPTGSMVESTLGGTVAGATFGQLQVTGPVTLGGTVSVTTANGFTPSDSQSFAVITSSTTAAGNLADFDQAGAPVGLSYFADPVPSGLDVLVQSSATSMVATAGTTPQSATVGNTFGTAPEVLVTDASDNPIAGVPVTFTAPSSGPSGTFANGTTTDTVVTNSSGDATASAFTAGTLAGAQYTVTATASGLTPVNFNLTNAAGAGASMTIQSGTGDQAQQVVESNAGVAVEVTDRYGNPVTGEQVNFSAPATGASGTFSNGSDSDTVATGSNGFAFSGFTANGTAGTYQVVASASGLGPQYFTFLNYAGPPASVSLLEGSPQSATVTTSFATPLAVVVTDADDNPVSGVSVVFQAPQSGPSGSFNACVLPGPDECTVGTNQFGIAAVTFVADSTIGGPYQVTVSYGSLQPVDFTLTNAASPLASLSVVAGTSQESPVSRPYSKDLTAKVVNSLGQPAAGVRVTFTAPARGASGTFAPCPGGNPTPQTCIEVTGANGEATASKFTANRTSGRFAVTASAPGVASVSFVLTNSAGYWLVGEDGGVFSFNTPFYGSTGDVKLDKPVIGITATPDGEGYWLYASDGGVFSFGDARFRGSTGNVDLVEPIVGMATDPATGGYWLIASDGGVFSFGAKFYGSLGGVSLSSPISGMVVAPGGNGYWLYSRTGQVFAFGPGARNYGSAPASAGAAPVVGMAVDPSGTGYWLTTTAGQVYHFGSATYQGSTAGVTLAAPVVGMLADPSTGGYWLVAADGGVFNYNAPYLGSIAGSRLNEPITEMAIDF